MFYFFNRIDKNFNEIKDQILNQSKEEELSNKIGLDENQQSLIKKSETEKEPSVNADLDKGKSEIPKEETQRKSSLVSEEKVEGKPEDLKNDRNYYSKLHGQLGYNYPRSNGAYPANYMQYYYNSMYNNPYMNYYGNNPNAMRMLNYYYNYNAMGNQNQGNFWNFYILCSIYFLRYLNSLYYLY